MPEAALQRVPFMERLLRRRQARRLTQAFDRCAGTAVGLHCQHCAGFDGCSVHPHGAGTTLRRVAIDVGSGQAGLLAQEMNEQHRGSRLAAILTPLTWTAIEWASIGRLPFLSTAEPQRQRDFFERCARGKKFCASAITFRFVGIDIAKLVMRARVIVRGFENCFFCFC